MTNYLKLNKKQNKGDILLLVSVIILTLIGILFIYSASNYSAQKTYGDGFYFVKKQLIGIALGIVAMLIFCKIDYNKLKKYCLIVSILSIILLIAVFIPYIGKENYGAKRWIGFGSFTIQPSEIAKFSFILFSATYISNNPSCMQKFVKILPILLFGLIICVLIMLEPNMSITVCMVLLMFSILISCGMKIKHLILIIIPVLVLGVLLVLVEPYRLKRLSAFIDPWSSPKGEGYQLLQSLYALGSGGWFGVGLFNSRQKFSFLPFSESDFILSIIGEEVGFVGLILFFAFLLFIIMRGIKIAGRAKNLFGYILAIGITMIFAIQVLVNVLVVSGSIPPTGLPLPLVSSGNTSIIIFMSEFGILYNISKQENTSLF